MIEQGTEIVETETKTYEYACYYFPYNEEDKYELIDKEMLTYLVHTRNINCIKIYIYLLNKYKWKRQEQETYNFTIAELKKVLGYADSTRGAAEAMITNILDSFDREGLIAYENTMVYVERNGEIISIPNKTLTFVAETMKQLKSK